MYGQFTVDGKISSLNSFLTPNQTSSGTELPDVDGSYGENDKGIFFFTVSGIYQEWNMGYHYTDVPLDVGDTIMQYDGDYYE